MMTLVSETSTDDADVVDHKSYEQPGKPVISTAGGCWQ